MEELKYLGVGGFLFIMVVVSAVALFFLVIVGLVSSQDSLDPPEFVVSDVEHDGVIYACFSRPHNSGVLSCVRKELR